MKKIPFWLKYILYLILMFVILPLFLLWSCYGLATIGWGRVTKTNDVSKYMEVKGNSHDGRARAQVSEFFPKKIEDSFEDVEYHYKAVMGDTYAFEMRLEFTLPTQQEYLSVLDKYSAELQPKETSYALSYKEYIAAEDFVQTSAVKTAEDGTLYIHIERADIKKILCSDEERRIVFVALCVFDGGYASTLELNDYFTRFGIVPWEYYAEDQTHLKYQNK